MDVFFHPTFSTKIKGSSLLKIKRLLPFAIRPLLPRFAKPDLRCKTNGKKQSPEESYFRAQLGWDGRIRTCEMTESKSVALPLGYIPTFNRKEI